MNDRVLLTGATGYVGGRLLRRLQEESVQLRCLARNPENIAGRVNSQTEVARADVLKPETLKSTMQDVDTAYYLIHSMGSGSDFEEADRIAAKNFGEAAREAGVNRIIYLGGLAHGRELSPHLRSRQEVGDLLRASGVPVLELQASIVIGSGSLSFEMIRALVERLPIMITPKWVDVQAQPIAIDDLLDYLINALDLPLEQSRTFEIGGTDRVSYGELMREYAAQRGLHRTMIRVPVLTPRLSSLWLGLVTPLYSRIGRRLVDSIKHPTVVYDEAARAVFPVQPRGMRAAVTAAIRNEDREIAETRWYDAFSSGGTPQDYKGVRFGSRLSDSRSISVESSPEEAFAAIQRIGGKNGWYAYNWLWWLRGTLDLLLGGVGMRRGRPHPQKVHVGDALDFWRVEAYEPGRLLRLHAEMKVPGRAWLEFEVKPTESGSVIRQTALFDPLGLSGLAYWHLISPLHGLVFSSMLNNIAKAGSRPIGHPEVGAAS